MKQCKRCGIALLEEFYTDKDLCLACSSINTHEQELEKLIKDKASEYDINSLKEFIEEEKRRWDNIRKEGKNNEQCNKTKSI